MEDDTSLGVIEEGSVLSIPKIVSDASSYNEYREELTIENDINVSIKEELPLDFAIEPEKQQNFDTQISEYENPLDISFVKEEFYESDEEIDNSTHIKSIHFCASSNDNLTTVDDQLPVEISDIKEEIVNIPVSNDDEVYLTQVDIKHELHSEEFEIETASVKNEINTEANYDDISFAEKEKIQRETPNDADKVVPVALKTNSEFARCSSKSDDDDDFEIIVPLENPLQIAMCLTDNTHENREIILGDKYDKLKELHEDSDEVDTLLAPRGYACLICGKTYRNLGSFQKHEKAHDQLINPVTKSPIPTPIISLKQLTDNITKESGIYSCGCGKQFRRKTSVSACMKVHRNSGVGCQWCPLVFLKQLDLRKHCRLDHPSHRKSKHRCITCNKVFLTRKSLKTHSKHHTKKTSSEITNSDQTDCEVNSKTEAKIVARKSVRHLSKNSDLNETLKFKFVCRICSEEFTTLGALTLHSSTHKKQKFICDRCQEKFSSKSELSSHRNLHCRGGDFVVPNPKVPTCDICEKVFPTEELMLKHKSTHPFVIFTKDDSTHTQIFFK